ncbi:MAG TPA: hypothetical protein VMT99_02495 [Candidatus Paceibacterota bacterium]|nr:hypothetical protein [Candidatus Paceibacterota bacterium]
MIVRFLRWITGKTQAPQGRISVLILFLGFLTAGAILGANFFATDALHHARFTFAQSTATTTVTVLNTPPNWTVDAQEAVESSTSSPTNAGNTVSWTAIATDPNSDSFYLLICKTSSTPTAGVGGGAPSCAGGAGNQWAVSSLAASAANATSTYTTQSSDPQLNPWFAWICDNNAGGAQCNATYKQGTGSTASPFVVNHRPSFASVSNTGPVNPGANLTWNSVASDTDTFAGATDTVTLYICKANDFTGTACGAGGTYCSSTPASSNPSCSYTIPIPQQDKSYNSFAYVIDQHLFAASGGSQSATSTYSVNNVAPTITSSSISLLNTDGSTNPLALTAPTGQTSGFQVKFTSSDNNSCQNSSGGQEVQSAIINVYRSGIGQANCQTSGNYNANNCYPAAVGTTTWNYFCSQDVSSCSGPTSLTATWTCTFPLWYVADPTDGTTASDTQYFNQNWLVSVRTTDDNAATSTLTESSVGNEVSSFLGVQLNTPSINFGALSPGTNNATLSTSTVLAATGNVGLNETLYGLDMCPNFPSCPVSPTSTIPVGQIQYATSAIAYGSGLSLATSPGSLFNIQIHKSTATSSATTGSTFWGIAIPGTIQLSGAYTGQNTFIGVKSPAQTW